MRPTIRGAPVSRAVDRAGVADGGSGTPPLAALLDELARRLSYVGGVQAVSVAATLPLGSTYMSPGSLFLPGQPVGSTIPLDWNVVYFSAMRIPLVAGRDFDSTGGSKGPNVLIINETAARRFWPSGNPVGKTVARKLFAGGADAFTVVGVAKDGKYRTPSELSRPLRFNSTTGLACRL